jgi:hypothetical protein
LLQNERPTYFFHFLIFTTANTSREPLVIERIQIHILTNFHQGHALSGLSHFPFSNLCPEDLSLFDLPTDAKTSWKYSVSSYEK